MTQARAEARNILVTRPEPEAEALAGRLRSAGLHAIVFPTLEIRPKSLTPAGEAALRRLGDAHLAVFISTNAVRHGLPLIEAAGGWPPGLVPAAVGKATKTALTDAGVAPVIAPAAGNDSEALLALPELHEVAGHLVLIFRGMGGRELLATALRARGAEVLYVECYERALPRADPAPVCRLLVSADLHAVVAASAEGISNLLKMLPAASIPTLLAVPLIVTHPRIAAAAQSLGFDDVRVVAPGDDALVQALAGSLARPAP